VGNNVVFGHDFHRRKTGAKLKSGGRKADDPGSWQVETGKTTRGLKKKVWDLQPPNRETRKKGARIPTFYGFGKITGKKTKNQRSLRSFENQGGKNKSGGVS